LGGVRVNLPPKAKENRFCESCLLTLPKIIKVAKKKRPS